MSPFGGGGLSQTAFGNGDGFGAPAVVVPPISLVGTVGAAGPSVSNGGGSRTPAWGTGSNRTAGNLLVAICSDPSTNTFWSTGNPPAGWSTAITKAGASFGAVGIYYKIAAGGDAAPTFNGGNRLYAQLMEFTGNAAASVLDQTGTLAFAATPATVTAAAADAASGELIIAAFSTRDLTNANTTLAMNNATAQASNSNGGTAPDMFNFGYGITTGNASADSATQTVSAGSVAGGAAVIATFKHS